MLAATKMSSTKPFRGLRNVTGSILSIGSPQMNLFARSRFWLLERSLKSTLPPKRQNAFPTVTPPAVTQPGSAPPGRNPLKSETRETAARSGTTWSESSLQSCSLYSARLLDTVGATCHVCSSHPISSPDLS